MNFSISQNPIFTQLENKHNILIAGAGGGYDIYSGLPLYLALKEQGKNVYLANLSFSFLHHKIAEEVYPKCFLINAEMTQEFEIDYFPEKYLARWLKNQLKEEVPIYAMPQTGVIPLTNVYQYLQDTLNLEAIILIDGGTDSLMFGDEAGLGTPAEDSVSIASVHQLKNIDKYLLCLGFGIDHFHGVSHYSFLENVAKLTKKNAYLGCFSITNQNKEGKAFLDLVNYVNEKMWKSPSIVANSVASAIGGAFGDYHATHRTNNSELFINPLMNLYWVFLLDEVAKQNQFLPAIMQTNSFESLKFIIYTFREEIKSKIKMRKDIPL